MALRLTIETGGEYLLPYAKKKLAELKQQAIGGSQNHASKVINVDSGAQIFLQTTSPNSAFCMDSIRITSSAGWNAFSDTGNEVHTYNAAKVTKILPAPSYTRASSIFPFADNSGLVVYRSAGNTVAHYLHGTALKPIVIYDPLDTAKTNPLFPRTGTTLTAAEIRFVAGQIFISATVSISGQLAVYVANANTQQLVTSLLLQPFNTTVSHFAAISKTEAWTLITQLTPAVSVASISTLGTQINYALPGSQFMSAQIIGIIGAEPVVMIHTLAITAHAPSQLDIVTAASSTAIFRGREGTGGLAGEQISFNLNGACFEGTPEYYEIIFGTTQPNATQRRMYSYSSQTGLVMQYEAPLLFSNTVLTIGQTQSKDLYLIAAFVHGGHLYAPMVVADAAGITNSYYLLSIFEARLGYVSATASIGAIICFRGSSESGYVLVLPDGSLRIITPTRTALIDQVVGTFSASIGLQNGGIVTLKDDVYFAYMWQSPFGSLSYRRIYKLLSGGIIDLGSFITPPAALTNPFMGGVLTSSKPYFYAKTRTADAAEVLATTTAEFNNLSVIDGTTGAISLVEALPRTAIPTLLQPPDFDKQIAAWNAT